GWTVWDPWHCVGSCADRMRSVFGGGVTVIHENKDCTTWRPDFDVLVGNSPFSNKTTWLRWALDTGRPFALLLPLELLVSLQFRTIPGFDELQVLLPCRRIGYERDGERRRAHFESAWICRGLLPRQLVYG
ncbi:MAG: hypothetical protein ACRECQ_09315, partial [Burkholderiaceae bacterium]